MDYHLAVQNVNGTCLVGQQQMYRQNHPYGGRGGSTLTFRKHLKTAPMKPLPTPCSRCRKVVAFSPVVKNLRPRRTRRVLLTVKRPLTVTQRGRLTSAHHHRRGIPRLNPVHPATYGHKGLCAAFARTPRQERLHLQQSRGRGMKPWNLTSPCQ